MIRTGSAIGATLALIAIVLAVAAPDLNAASPSLLEQNPAGDPGADAEFGDTIHVASSELEAASLAFAAALAGRSREGLAEWMGSEGIRLHLEGTSHAGLSARQAVASLREFLRAYDHRSTVVTRAAPVEDSPDRGFAEVRWSARVSGTSQEIERTLFLGLYRDSERWWVDEVRLLR